MRSVNPKVWRRLPTLAALALLAGVAGCGSGLHPVTGRVTFDDGGPLNEGVVICEMQEGEQTVMARGTLKPDGTFRLGTKQPGDGAKPGRYRVLVAPRALTEKEAATTPPVIDRKFEKFETSGIEFEVKEGTNELLITVTRPKPRR